MAVRAERGPAALSPLRTVALAIGFICAIAASVTIFVTEDADYLRIGILVALWGFVFAALAAGRRQTEQVVAASAEVELRKSYEVELEREVAARREYELRLEAQLRRELQDDFASQVGVLHEEMVRLRRELSEQWDSELRVERMVMRTQSVRMAGDRSESLEQAPNNRASIDAVPLDAQGWDATEHDDGDRASQADSPVAAFDDRPETREFPAVSVAPPSHPTAPVPPVATATPPNLPTSANVPAPPPMPAPQKPPEPSSDDDDVLTRVLAEAGAPAGGRRRKHRYADDESS